MHVFNFYVFKLLENDDDNNSHGGLLQEKREINFPRVPTVVMSCRVFDSYIVRIIKIISYSHVNDGGLHLLLNSVRKIKQQ